jgi:pyrroline-5-carboxylate reductase
LVPEFLEKEHKMNKIITFIGSGNMAQSLVGGLLQDGYDKTCIRVSDINKPLLQQVADQFGVATFVDNQVAIDSTDVLIVAVKPLHVKDMLSQLNIAPTTLIVSIAAGILVKDLENWSGNNNAVVRCMPNTPSLVQSGAAGLFANALANGEQKDLAESILRAVGLTVWVDNEQQIDAVTAVSGSGPAYYFMFMEAMVEAAMELGLSKEQAQLLTKQTAFGAAKMALESPLEPDVLRQNVTSKKGTTEKALNSFKESGLHAMVKNAMSAAKDRSAEMAIELGDS